VAHECLLGGFIAWSSPVASLMVGLIGALETFIETYDQVAWSPYTDVSQQIVQRPAGSACPELPPIELPYGE
jgi:hypothetical protein